ncbi:hypothetical protein CN470_21340 [Bacillus cereus]|uniref:hypothetical protein n=1 Tax=Bacillus cereus group TaxID=86661 RepID=UPI000BA27B23|nr:MULTISPECIES: hypothetical protein [Bacillus cereus group]MBJ8085248.1 hypothetical protein [Bacillus cereus]MCU4831904.1 hypothetical protein [Bacillus cereus]PEQ59609.1 hypothetical protein CN470_21340 [Bacillus cereus]
MENTPRFINQEQRDNLREVLKSIENIQDNITFEYEEYFLIRSIIGDLKSAIKCKEQFEK